MRTPVWEHTCMRTHLYENTPVWEHTCMRTHLYENTPVWQHRLYDSTTVWEHSLYENIIWVSLQNTATLEKAHPIFVTELTEPGWCKNMRFQKKECRRQLQIPGPRKVTWRQFRTDAHKFWSDLWTSHLSRSVSGQCTWVILWALGVGGAVQNLDARATGAKYLCPLTKTACTTVPEADEDVHIYIRCATRIFRRGGTHSDAIYEQVMSDFRNYVITTTSQVQLYHNAVCNCIYIQDGSRVGIQ